MWKNTSKNQVQQYMQQNPYRLLALSFLAAMTIGTILLMLPYHMLKAIVQRL